MYTGARGFESASFCNETEKESYDLKEWYKNYLIRLDLITVANDKGNLIVNATSNL